MKKLIKGLGLSLALAANTAFAIPTLQFDGNIEYSSEALQISGLLIGITDLPAASVDLGSGQLSLDAIIEDYVYMGPGATAAAFSGIDGDDLRITDSSGTLLTGEFSSLYMVGANGANYGVLGGTFTATGGSLASFFGMGELIAMEFNLDSTFGRGMFDQSFSGRVNGAVRGADPTPVPEPGVLALLGAGLLLIAGVRKAGQRNRA